MPGNGISVTSSAIMKKIGITFFISLVLIAGSSFFTAPAAPIEKISASIISRQVQSGQSVTVKGEICYQRNGNMITHFTYPKQYFVVSNKQGEVKLYDPSRNTVLLYQNFLFSTQSSQFYYFFSGKIADMGLGEIGYMQEKIYPEKNLMVSLWKLKVPDKKVQIQRVRLVYQRQQPVYMHYEDVNNRIIRKVYYSNYTHMENYAFPNTTTEIAYGEGDSTVSKTSYFDFKFNLQASSQYFNFRIPDNAKIEK